MSKEALIAGHERKRAFLKAYIAEGSYLKIPATLSANQWSMRRTIGFQHGLKDKTLKELGSQYGITRERARQLNRNFLDNACQTSSPQLQAQYPRETIPDRKPLGQKPRERISKTHGGLSLKVRKLVQEGVTDPNQIRNTLGISTEELAAARITLEGWGVNVPRTIRTIRLHKEIVESIANENNDEKLQELLDSLSANQLRGFLQSDSDHETLTTVSAIANKQGFHVHTIRVRFIAATIEEAKIPIRKIEHLGKNRKLLSSYYLVYTKHEDRIAELLNNDQDLQRFR